MQNVLQFVLALAGVQTDPLTSRQEERLAEIRPHIERVAREEEVPEALIGGIIGIESNYKADAQGPELPSGERAQGLMQVIPVNLRRMNILSSQWLDPLTNIRAGVKILTYPPAPLGRVSFDQALAQYGGFRATDPAPYINRIRTEAATLAIFNGLGVVPPGRILPTRQV